MLVLALDTSTTLASVAVVEAGTVLAELEGPSEAKHGETLLSVIETALVRAGVSLGQIDLLAAGIGPGSFTGVRVGLATAKGLALATGKPLVGIVSLRAMARGGSEPGQFTASILDAYRNEVYWALYQTETDGNLIERLPPLNQSPEIAADQIGRTIGDTSVQLRGNGAGRYKVQFTSRLRGSVQWAGSVFDTPRASALAYEAISAFEKHGPGNLASMEPLYVRPSDALPPNF